MIPFYVQVERATGSHECRLSLRVVNSERHESIMVGPIIFDEATAMAMSKWLENALPKIQRVVVAAELRDMAMGIDLEDDT